MFRPSSARIFALAGIFMALAFAAATAAPKAAATPPPEFFGLSSGSAGVSLNTTWSRIDSTGAKTSRVEFNWKRDFYGGASATSCPSSPTPSSGFSTTITDAVMRNSAIRGITLLPYLTGSFCSQGYPEPGSAEMTAWNSFVEDLADRYGPGGTFWAGNWDGSASTYTPMPIEKWQIGNEPNLAENNPSGVLEPQKYGKFLIESSASIKSSQPSAKILMGGLFGSADVYGFLDDMYNPDPLSPCCSYTAAQLNAAFDGMGLHPYDVTGVTSDVTTLIGTARIALNTQTNAFGAAKPISITEIGWPVGNNVISKCSNTATANHSGQTQRRNLNQFYTWAVANYASLGLDLAAWNSENDSGATCGTGGSVAPANVGQIYSKGKSGLFETHVWSKRPSFCEYVLFTAATDCARGVGLLASPVMDVDHAGANFLTAYVNDSAGISIYEGLEGKDLSTSGATAGSEPGVSLDPGSGQARVIYRTTDGHIGLWQRANWAGAWSHSTMGSAGDIAANTSPGVHRAGSSADGTLVTSLVYRDGSGQLIYRAETALGWYGPATLAGSISAKTSPSITRDPTTGISVIAYRDPGGQIGTTSWTSSFGWTSGLIGGSVDTESSPDIGRDPATGLQVVAYRNTSDIAATRYLLSGSWTWGGASSGVATNVGADPKVAMDDLHGTAAIAFSNGSDGVSTWRMSSGGTWASPTANPGVVAGPGTNPDLVIGHDSLGTDDMVMTYTNGENTFLAQRLAFNTGTNWVWDTPIRP